MKNPKPFLFVSIILLSLVPCGAQAKQPSPSIIPQPVKMQVSEGAFTISPDTRVVAEGKGVTQGQKMIDSLAPAIGFQLKLINATSLQDKIGKIENSKESRSTRKGNEITLSLDSELDKTLGAEGYQLDVTADQIKIAAAQPAGLFYGVQTLRQLLPSQIFSKKKAAGVTWTAPCVSITDYPRFAWRGLLIDPARHFIPVKDVKKYIDTMALHKYNSLQMHLTDDQGWRIEIKKYPRLTEVGSWREHTLGDGKRHGGFYTQDDIRELVRYAVERHITILPEIEMPGHFRAAISSYPNLGTFPEKQKNIRPWTRWGISADILAPRPEGLQFCKDVLTEVIELFPSKYIHIGGDEAKKEQWKQSEEIQRMIRDKGLKTEDELQAWFIKQMDTFLASKDRRLVGWDEILQGGLAPGATVMSWRGERGGITAARAGHDVVMAPTSHTYFDHRQNSGSLAKVYSYEPIPAALDAKQARHVLGAQGQLWGERINNESHREFMTYPRACALIETVWSPKKDRDFKEFTDRINIHLQRLDAAEINYRKLDY